MKRRNRSALYSVLSSPFTLIAAVVLFSVLARAAWSIHQKAVESALRLEVAQAELARIQNSQADLAARVDQLSTPAGVKAQIRERYHAVEPGESVAVIVDAVPTSSSAAAAYSASRYAATSSPDQNESWWQRFLRVFWRD